MRELGLEGARRGRRHRTTIADPAAARPADLVQRRFSPARPDAVWVADFTYVATWSGTVYVTFVLDAHSRRILGWRAHRRPPRPRRHPSCWPSHQHTPAHRGVATTA